MRKHFLILMLLTLLPLAGWAAPIIIGDYTYERSKDVINKGETSAPTITVKKGNVAVTTYDGGIWQINATTSEKTKVNTAISGLDAGVYYQLLYFYDGAVKKALYVPFYVAAEITSSATEVNDATSFNAQINSADNTAYKQYYAQYKWADVWYQYGTTEADGVILYPGETPTASSPYKEGTGYNPTPEQYAQANTWFEGLEAPTGTSITRSWNATKISNPDNMTFTFNDEGEWKIAVTYNDDATSWYAWGDAVFGKDDKTYGLISLPNDIKPHFNLTSVTYANIKLWKHLAQLPAAQLINATFAVATISDPVYQAKDLTIGTDFAYEVKATETGDAITTFTTRKFYTDAACETETTHLYNAGQYYAKFAQEVDGFAYESIVPFQIQKAGLLINVLNATKEWGDDDPTTFTYVAMSPFKGADHEGNVAITYTAERQNGETLGDYNYTSLTATAANYEIDIQSLPKLTITQKDISKLAFGGQIIIVGDDTPDYTGSAIEPEITVYYNGGGELPEVLASSNYSVGYTKNVNVKYDNNVPANVIADATITVTGTGNYTGVLTKKFAIQPKAFDADIVITADKDAFIYNAAVQKPVYTVKFGDLTLTENDGEHANDYTITWSNSTSTNYDANAYTAKFDFTGNYTNAATTDEARTQSYTIAKATVAVTPSTSKVYDGTTALPAANTTNYAFEYEGYYGDLAAFTAGVTVTAASLAPASSDVAKDKGTYKLTVSKNAFEHANYKFITKEGTFEITAKSGLVITADNKENVAHGTADKDLGLTCTVTGNATPATPATATADEIAAIKNAVTLAKGNWDNTKKKYVITVTPKTDANSQKVLGNYQDLTATTPINYTLTNGWLTYDKGEVVIYVKSGQTFGKEYDGATETEVAINNDQLVFEGITSTDGIVVKGILNNAKNAGEHAMVLQATGINENEYNVSTVNSKYTITQKEVTFDIPAQTLIAGAAATTFNTAANVTGLVANEANPYVLKTPAVQGGSIVAYNDNGNNEYAITPKVSDATGAAAIAANYTFVASTSWGKAYVTVSGALVLDDQTDLADLTAEDLAKTNVSFTDRAIKANTWTMMVLPFNATVRQISKAFGYAVVDLFDTSKSGVNFGITMGTIPAYTPFIFKTDEATNMNKVTFTGITLVAANSAVAEENLTQEGLEYNFVGTIKKGQPETTAQYIYTFGSSNDNTNDIKLNKYAVAVLKDEYALKALRAYIVAASSAVDASQIPSIYIEEADGSTTVIESVNANAMAAKADGWYTVNGVKLQGVPTEKGVYINNGKKVVIK